MPVAPEARRRLDWLAIWSSVAIQLNQYRDAGLALLLTEDVVRFSTIQQLVAAKVPAAAIEPEWRRPGSRDAVDLVVTTGGIPDAVEFKYPREPRETNAAWTQHLGEVLKDYYRLAYMPAAFEERWCVQLLSRRVRDFLSRSGERHRVQLNVIPGSTTTLRPEDVRALPATALSRLDRWSANAQIISSRCVTAHPVGDDLLLVVHAVSAATDPTPSA